jgi:hypothetical protein
MASAAAGVRGAVICLSAAVIGLASFGQESAPAKNPGAPSYENVRLPRGPWSIHVVRVPRGENPYEVRTVHAAGRATGLSSLSRQLRTIKPNLGTPIAAINGDFYRRDGGFAGDPRGLQIVEGELISAPTGSASFWIDALGQPHATNTASLLAVTWPNGKRMPMGLNGSRRSAGAELYTPALGPTTGTSGGREFVLEAIDQNQWLPLRPGRVYRARVREVNQDGNTAIGRDTVVLSVGPSAARGLPAIEVGTELSFSTETRPSLRGVKTAISGGPVLVLQGKRQRMVEEEDSDSYRFSSMLERHPRSAVGWNDEWFFLVQVDGRHRTSVGMTLNELAAFMVQLGCQGALNLDGGGSSTLWYDGAVRNRPCDGRERPVANSLVVTKSAATEEASGGAAGGRIANP